MAQAQENNLIKGKLFQLPECSFNFPLRDLIRSEPRRGKQIHTDREAMVLNVISVSLCVRICIYDPVFRRLYSRRIIFKSVRDSNQINARSQSAYRIAQSLGGCPDVIR
jgi:hypothetical protein